MLGVDCAGAARGVGLGQGREDTGEGRRKVRRKAWASMEPSDRRLDRGALVLASPCAGLEHDQAEGIEIDCWSEVVSVDLLGGHVAGGADGETGLGVLCVSVEKAGDSEVGQQRAASRAEKDVAGLDVAVDDAGRVAVRESRRDLRADVSDTVRGKASTALLERRRQAGSDDELEDQERMFVTDAGIENGDQVRVVQTSQDLSLGHEACALGGVGGPLPHQLHGHVATQGPVLRPVDVSHPPATQQSPEHVATGRTDGTDAGGRSSVFVAGSTPSLVGCRCHVLPHRSSRGCPTTLASFRSTTPSSARTHSGAFDAWVRRYLTHRFRTERVRPSGLPWRREPSPQEWPTARW